MPRVSILQDQNAVTKAVTSSSSMKETLVKLGLRAAGGNYKQLHKACRKFNLTPPIMNSNIQTLKARTKRTIPLEDILIEHSTYTNRYNIKKRCYKLGLLIEECYICKQKPKWNNQPLTLQLDHINGIFNDNRIENLRILCPNCHSQTHSFAGKNLK